jgi:hypothetical protein
MSRGRIIFIHGLRFGRITPASRGCLYFRSLRKDSMQNRSLTVGSASMVRKFGSFGGENQGQTEFVDIESSSVRPNRSRRNLPPGRRLRLFKIDINQNDIRMKNKSITVVDVYNHFSQRELSTDSGEHIQPGKNMRATSTNGLFLAGENVPWRASGQARANSGCVPYPWHVRRVP